jgi:excisionase family DNA binding protein
MTVQDFVQQYGVSRRTVYRWIESGKIRATKIDDKWDIDDDIDIDVTYGAEYADTNKLLQQQIEQLQGENQYLRNKLDQAQEDRLRADTIIMQLTKQFEQQTLLLEDMRNRSLWRRLKMAFVRVDAPPVTEQGRF